MKLTLNDFYSSFSQEQKWRGMNDLENEWEGTERVKAMGCTAEERKKN